MAKLVMDWENEQNPKRGDLLDFPKTRYMVVRVKAVKRRDPEAGRRFNVFAVKLQELTLKRMRLFAGHAHRHGGQMTWPCKWNSRDKKKMTFEELMRSGK